MNAPAFDRQAQSTAVRNDSTPAPTTREGVWLGLLPGRQSNDAANDEAGDEGEAKDSAAEHRFAQALTRTVVSQRLVIARELCGWSQTEGARALGYRNSGQLSMVESGKKTPTLALLVRAADVFGVSLDFLLGAVDEPERDPRLARRAAMHRLLNNRLAKVADALADAFEHEVSVDPVHARPLVAAAASALECFERVAARPEFEELPGGALLNRRMRELAEALESARQGLRRKEAQERQLRERLTAARVNAQAGASER
jgi:transcriptional regulator with XRE-family HTH domain